MGIFDNLFGIFRGRKEVAKKFHKAYEYLYLLSEVLARDLKYLRDKQKELVDVLEGKRFAGHASKSKTLVIEEELIPKLEKLKKKTEKQIKLAEEELREIEDPITEEETQLAKVFDLLNDIKKVIITEKEISRYKTTRDKLTCVESCLQEITNILREFHKIDKDGIEKKLLKDFRKMKLVREVYNKCHEEKVVNPLTKKEFNLSVYDLSKRELDEFQRQADFINSHNDKKNNVIWRRFWRDVQRPEKDIGTGFTKEHINVWIQLNGKEQKNIHLVMRS